MIPVYQRHTIQPTQLSSPYFPGLNPTEFSVLESQFSVSNYDKTAVYIQFCRILRSIQKCLSNKRYIFFIQSVSQITELDFEFLLLLGLAISLKFPWLFSI